MQFAKAGRGLLLVGGRNGRPAGVGECEFDYALERHRFGPQRRRDQNDCEHEAHDVRKTPGKFHRVPLTK